MDKKQPEDMSLQELADNSALPPFDYSELDTKTADGIRWCTNELMKIRKNYIWETAKIVKIAHDDLANYHEGMFRAWLSFVGIGKDTANRLLSVVALCDNSTPEEKVFLEQAPAMLLYAAAKKDAPQELVEAVKSGDITTNKEFQALKRELAETQKERDGARQAMEAAKTRGDRWQAKVEELERRPVEVAVQEPDPEEVDRLATEKAREFTAVLQAQLDALQTPPELDDDGNNRLYDQVLLCRRMIDSAWGMAKPSYKRLPADMRSYLTGMLKESIEKIGSEL